MSRTASIPSLTSGMSLLTKLCVLFSTAPIKMIDRRFAPLWDNELVAASVLMLRDLPGFGAGGQTMRMISRYLWVIPKRREPVVEPWIKRLRPRRI